MIPECVELREREQQEAGENCIMGRTITGTAIYNNFYSCSSNIFNSHISLYCS
jgi:hypothetical protein